jgi:hypothetical protein
MALSPSEAFLSPKERKQLHELEKKVDTLLSGYTGGNAPLYFTHTLRGKKDPPFSVLNALIDRYTRAGWKKIGHANTAEGKGIAFSAF